MHKIFIVCLIALGPSLTSAMPLEQMMSTKDRLRIALWVEGIEIKKLDKVEMKNRPLPEEIEKPLKKFL